MTIISLPTKKEQRFQDLCGTKNIRQVGKTYDNYDYITKILRGLLRRWRPQVIALRTFKDLKKLPMEELLGMLKVHEMKLNEDEGQWKGKSIALKAHKAQHPKPSR
ncbi:hypothetical protein CR513_09084, partial [Mucuna pruriens]